MRKILLSLLLIPFVFIACEKDKAPSVWMRFSINGLQYEMKGKNAVYYDEANSIWGVGAATYISGVYDMHNYKDSMAIIYPVISFMIPGKSTGSWNETDLAMLSMNLSESMEDVYGWLYFGIDTISLQTKFSCTLTENSEDYCAGTFQGKLFNANGDSVIVEGGDFRVRFYDVFE